jgi:hypothetical protein
MSAVIFSALQYAKTLQAVGFTKEQSETLSEGIGYGLHTTQDLATKNELYEVRDQLNQKIDAGFDHLRWKMTCIENNKADMQASGNSWDRKYFGRGWIDISEFLLVICVLTQIILVVMVLSSARHY